MAQASRIQGNNDPTKTIIRRPDRPEHSMELELLPGKVSAWVGSTRVASSRRALLVKETANTALGPVVYFPPEDVQAELLIPVDKTTSCALKGVASYYDIAASPFVQEGAWQYQSTHSIDPRLAMIECCVAFDLRFVTVEIS
jgi:uncharacterized protein (DUF427 family)